MKESRAHTVQLQTSFCEGALNNELFSVVNLVTCFNWLLIYYHETTDGWCGGVCPQGFVYGEKTMPAAMFVSLR